VCRTTSAVALWRSEFNGGSEQEFYVQYWRISQPLPSMLSPSIPDDRLTTDNAMAKRKSRKGHYMTIVIVFTIE
jgi:hypothetical protein